MGGSGGSRFRIFRFVLIPNEKFAHFLLFYEVRIFGSIRGSVFFRRFEVRCQSSEDEPRFGRLEVRYS